MKTRNALVIAALSAGLFLTVQTGFAQGSLTPPGGPGPTMKTLSQVEPRTPISSLPYTITTPGSYFVTANLTGISGSDGIDIKTNDVTLDLGGFTLLGVPGSGAGINVPIPQGNLTIRNGVLDSWGGNGAYAGGSVNCQFERLRISNSGSVGLAAGSNCVVSFCTSSGNYGDGIVVVGNNSTVSDCTEIGSIQGIGFFGGPGTAASSKACTARGQSIWGHFG